VATAISDGIQIHYEADGAGSPPLVFVHGWCCDTRYFAKQFEHFKADHRVVSLDLRGHGESGPGPISIETFADDVAAVAQADGATRPIIVGHSMGAVIALEVATRHPGLAAGVVLVDPAPMEISPELGAQMAGLLEGLAGPDSPAVRRGFLEGSPFFFEPTDDPAVKSWVTDAMCAAPDDVALAGMQAIGAWAAANGSAQWDLPVLVILAAGGLNNAESMEARGFEVEQTPDVGHFNQILAADRVNAFIGAFAEKVSQAQAPSKA
jgi:pimeloyl-ACP methyl ester carboxylesterase